MGIQAHGSSCEKPDRPVCKLEGCTSASSLRGGASRSSGPVQTEACPSPSRASGREPWAACPAGLKGATWPGHGAQALLPICCDWPLCRCPHLLVPPLLEAWPSRCLGNWWTRPTHGGSAAWTSGAPEEPGGQGLCAQCLRPSGQAPAAAPAPVAGRGLGIKRPETQTVKKWWAKRLRGLQSMGSTGVGGKSHRPGALILCHSWVPRAT